MLQVFLAIVGYIIGLVTIFITIKLYKKSLYNSRVEKALDSIVKIEIMLRNLFVSGEVERGMIIPQILDVLFELEDVLRRLDVLKNKNIDDGAEYLNNLQCNIKKYWSKKQSYQNHPEILDLFRSGDDDNIPKELMILKKGLKETMVSVWWWY